MAARQILHKKYDATFSVYGYIRRIQSKLIQRVIPEAIYDLCFIFFYIHTDYWDEGCKGNQITVDNEELTVYNDGAGGGSVFGEIVCKDHELHHWRLIVNKSKSSIRSCNAIMIGIIDVKLKREAAKHGFCTKEATGYAIYSGVRSCTIKSVKWDDSAYCKDKLFHDKDSIIDVYFNTKNDKNTLSFKINQEDMGVAYILDKDEADEYCLAVTLGSGFGLKLLEYEFK